MLAPDDAKRNLHSHFAQVSEQSFLSNVDKYAPEAREQAVQSAAEQSAPRQLVLLRPEPSPLPLKAYLASALSGLTHEQRQYVFQLSDAVKLICEVCDIDLYEPRIKTDPVLNPEVSDSEVWALDYGQVASADLLIHLCHYPSTGSGEELDFAYNALVPTLLISHDESHVSRMVTGIPGLNFRLSYAEPEELRAKLQQMLSQIRPLLEERKLAFRNTTPILWERESGRCVRGSISRATRLTLY